MELFGKTYTKKEIMRRVGDISQIGGARESVLTSGRADGVRTIDVRTGSGLEMTILPSRCMDIAQVSFRGIPVNFLSKTGIVAPAYYETDTDGFHRSFFAGMLTTCGLRNAGRGVDDRGEYVGLHGRIGNLPAEDVGIRQEWDGDDYRISLYGRMRESKLYGENLALEREITTSLGSREFHIRDRVTNEGFQREEIMLLYHCNFGFPLLAPSTKITLPPGETQPRDDHARSVMDAWDIVEEPQVRYPETVFFHHPEADENHIVRVTIQNPELADHGFGVELSYDNTNLPFLIQWKNMMDGDYVMAFEPANCYPVGRSAMRETGRMAALEAGETKEYNLTLAVKEG